VTATSTSRGCGAAVRADVWLEGYARWIAAWTPAILVGWCGRHRIITAVLVAGFGVCVIGVAHAAADPGTGSDSGGGDVLISWMAITDSDGVPVAKYTLTLNQGGWDDPTSKACAMLASIAYEIYLCLTASALWLIHFVMDFGWLSIFTGPFQTIGRGVDTAMDRFGLAPTAVAVLAIIAVATVLAGRTAKAVSHLAMGLLMVGLAATIFAHPLSQLVGPDGMLAKGRDTGLQIMTAVSDGAVVDRGGAATVDDMVARLADRFLRKPTQMINFGEVSDSVSRTCRHAWSRGIKAGHGDTLKDDIEGCDATKGPAMHQKSMGSPAAVLVPLSICGLLSVILVAFACYFVWHVVRAAVQAMLCAALAPPAFAIGVIPGGAQTFAWKTILDCAMAYAAMIIYTAAFGGYNVILDQVFTEPNAIKAMFVTALVLAFGFAFFGPLRRMLDRQRDNVAARLSGGTAGGSGRGWPAKNAHLSRIKHNIGQHVGRGRPPGGGARAPGRIEPEADSAGSRGNHTASGRGGTGPSGVSIAATGGGQRPPGSSQPHTQPTSGRGGAGTRAEPAAVFSAGRSRERPAEPPRRPPPPRGGVVAARAGGSGRHALSEAA
jgi:hypothetical protein